MSNNVDEATIECSAFTVAELGEMLPESSYTTKVTDGWVCNCVLVDEQFFRANTEANARAKMMIYLLEKKLI
jgi:hypothetical protein